MGMIIIFCNEAAHRITRWRQGRREKRMEQGLPAVNTPLIAAIAVAVGAAGLLSACRKNRG